MTEHMRHSKLRDDPGDGDMDAKVGAWSRQKLVEMDERFCEALRRMGRLDGAAWAPSGAERGPGRQASVDDQGTRRRRAAAPSG
jgi:hypothetical protein